MDLLFVGGSRFVGLHLVQAALAAGHRVTVFNRGQHADVLPAEVAQRVGDRRQDLSALAQGRWDAVIDTCGYLPAEVAAMADCLQGRVGRYVFISSVSVYADFRQPNHEHSPLGVIDDPDTELVDGRTYGPLKALCEQALTERVGEGALCLRPGLIVGPHDPSGRFSWWPARVARARPGESVLVPDTPDAALQFIDVRDLAAFTLSALAQGLSGPVNVAAPAGHYRMGALLGACAAAAGHTPNWVWAPSAWLRAQGVQPWMELPLWLPAAGEHAAFMAVDTLRAQAAGLRIRPLAETVADTLAWWQQLPEGDQGFANTGLAAERERALLAALGAASLSAQGSA